MNHRLTLALITVCGSLIGFIYQDPGVDEHVWGICLAGLSNQAHTCITTRPHVITNSQLKYAHTHPHAQMRKYVHTQSHMHICAHLYTFVHMWAHAHTNCIPQQIHTGETANQFLLTSRIQQFSLLLLSWPSAILDALVFLTDLRSDMPMVQSTLAYTAN